MNIRQLYRIMFLLTIYCSVASAQIEKKAQVGFRFLENPVSAEVVGRGMVGLTIGHSSDAIFWNPALLGWLEPTIDISLHHTKGIADINYNAAAGTFRLGEFGVLGFSFMAMDYGTFYSTYAVEKTINELGYVETGTFSPQAYAVGIAFAQKVNARFSYGVHIKYANQDLGSAWVASEGQIVPRGYSKGAVALDVGTYYDFEFHGIRFGATLQNISKEIKYENEAFPLPFAVSFGLAVQPLTFLSDAAGAKDLTVNVETRHPRDFGEKIKYGAEYTCFDIFTARVGYVTNQDERGLTAGAGVRQDVSGVPMRVDYAYEPFGVFGAVHFVSLGISY
ncbi:MAG: PorV/PorQ family protein [Ignavibacteriales bacterium]|nr:PorV/PorQ family protein [Ignavibacteriales bacterium]